MNVVFIGDIVGPDAAAYVARRVPELRREHDAALVIANGENVAVTGPAPEAGYGLTIDLVDLLLGNGVDVITGGNHSWDGPQAGQVLEHPRVLRPHNMPEGTSGRGLVTVGAGRETVTMVNLTDPRTVPGALPPYPTWQALKATHQLVGTVIVDLHSNHASGKQGFAYAIDGEAAAVLGTDTHEPTLPLRILPKGTGQVTDVGMTGPTLGYGGVDAAYYVTRSRAGNPGMIRPFELAKGPIELAAVVLRIVSGRTEAITRIG